MSQIIFRCKQGEEAHPEQDARAHEVMTGWDRPLGYVHFTVFTAGEEALYSELDFPNAFAMRASDVIAKLRELHIVYPTDLQDRIGEHSLRGAGNERYVYPAGWDAAALEAV